MGIKAQCGNCKGQFTAKDKMAGRKVKCPKCKNPMAIPNPAAAKQPAAVPAAPAYNPLLDLLDEAEVKAASRGPVCENCGEELQPNAVMCIDCGFNQTTGTTIEREIYDDDFDDDEGDYTSSGLSDAETIMQKAEREIDDMPVTAVGQNFGDGADSILIAGIAFAVLAVMVVMALFVLYFMDILVEEYEIESSFISMLASMGMAFMCYLWITFVAFKIKPGQGIACACTLGLYCVIFGFMQGKTLLLPTVILLVSMFIGLLSWFFWRLPSDGVAMVETIVQATIG